MHLAWKWARAHEHNSMISIDFSTNTLSICNLIDWYEAGKYDLHCLIPHALLIWCAAYAALIFASSIRFGRVRRSCEILESTWVLYGLILYNKHLFMQFEKKGKCQFNRHMKLTIKNTLRYIIKLEGKKVNNPFSKNNKPTCIKITISWKSCVFECFFDINHPTHPQQQLNEWSQFFEGIWKMIKTKKS